MSEYNSLINLSASFLQKKNSQQSNNLHNLLQKWFIQLSYKTISFTNANNGYTCNKATKEIRKKIFYRPIPASASPWHHQLSKSRALLPTLHCRKYHMNSLNFSQNVLF
jgi:hypothetical protein